MISDKLFAIIGALGISAVMIFQTYICYSAWLLESNSEISSYFWHAFLAAAYIFSAYYWVKGLFACYQIYNIE